MIRGSRYRSGSGPGGLTGWRRTAALLLIAAFVIVPVVIALSTVNG